MLKFNDFKVKSNGSGIEVCISRSKTNQRGMEGGLGKFQIILKLYLFMKNILQNVQ